MPSCGRPTTTSAAGIPSAWGCDGSVARCGASRGCAGPLDMAAEYATPSSARSAPSPIKRALDRIVSTLQDHCFADDARAEKRLRVADLGACRNQSVEFRVE